MLIVCGGWQVRDAVDDKVVVHHPPLCRPGRAAGCHLYRHFRLAKAGVLNGYRCAIHWENLPSISEEFPKTKFTSDLFVLDRDRFTCSGGARWISCVT
jgi:transcriptional regulator GlxA family with amidase domain